LRVDDFASAQRAMHNVDEPCIQAQLRIEAGRWVGKHPASAEGRDVLRDTVARTSAFEPWWSRRDVTDLVPIVAVVLGVEHVEAMAQQLKDPFTAGNVHATLSYALTDPAAKREQLRKAEALATGVREGDRDFALRWVFEGYREAGFNDDAERLRRLAAMDPEDLTRTERTVLANADSVLAKADTILDRHPADTLSDRLRRFMEYGFNDLKVLQLPAKGCQFAALHGLNHLHPSDAAAELVRRYLADHQGSLTADEIAWVEACASGEAP
jgi:hypothetical protein